MKRLCLQTLFLILLQLLWMTGVLAEDKEDHERARHLHQHGKILSLEQILKQVLTKKPGEILEVELERKEDHFIYEVEILGKDGIIRKLYFDAAKGTFLSEKIED
ncbi:MAG: PepSY domain-containing protein [Magnetococcus sp. DMHC-6]